MADDEERLGAPKYIVMVSSPSPVDDQQEAIIFPDASRGSDKSPSTSSSSEQPETEEARATQKTSAVDRPIAAPDAGTESALSTDSVASGESGSESDLEDNDDEEEDDSDEGPPSAWLRASRPSIPRNRDVVTALPDTVTRLEMLNGSQVYLVGTAHFSLESQEDVAKTIQATQPDIVVMELCSGRVNILRMDEKTILEEAKVMNFEKVVNTIKQNGFVHGVMYLFLLSMSAHLTKQLGMAPGGEFRRAFSEAKKVPGCLVHLGDRPIQVTLQRALAELSVWQKLCLVWCMVSSKDPVSKEEVERYKNRDLLEEMLAEMTGKFPSISRVFVKERDVFLTHSLHLAASPIQCANSESGFVPSVVVGIVGIGHVPGIVEHWGKVNDEDIPPLLRIPESSLSNRLFRYAVKASVWGLVLYGGYKIATRPTITILLASVLSPLKSKSL